VPQRLKSTEIFAATGHAVKKIGLPETSLGVIPGAGGTQRAVRILGLSKAKDLIYTARMLDAAEAHEWGMGFKSVHFGTLAEGSRQVS
jgi:enoyl-CoA hydratase/carnithine racemase